MSWSEADFKNLFLNNIPLIDVRAPVEYLEGHFPHSVNLPLMNDEERRLVGIDYKQNGQESAVRLGHQLVSGEIKEQRVAAWINFLKDKPHAQLYCFRGGMRSQIATDWIKESGIELKKITGGYKALRQYLMKTFDQIVPTLNFTVISGRTGSGKTPFLYQTKLPMVDLEKIANHRGSSFGNMGIQPTQINFENNLTIELMRLTQQGHDLLVEDESRRIGNNQLPLNIYDKKQISPMILIEESLEERVETIYSDYIETKPLEYLQGSLERISKKLGGKNYQEISQKLKAGSHREWIRDLLILYYDPLYDYHLKLKKNQILFRGTKKECLNYLNEKRSP